MRGEGKARKGERRETLRGEGRERVGKDRGVLSSLSISSNRSETTSTTSNSSSSVSSSLAVQVEQALNMQECQGNEFEAMTSSFFTFLRFSKAFRNALP